MKITCLSGVVGIWLVAALAPAQVQDKGPPKKFPPALLEMLKKGPDELIKQFDKNADGFLQKDELPPFLAKNFDAYDRNKDSKLSREETGQMLQVIRQFLAAQTPSFGGAADFDALDKNADGRLTKEELKGSPWQARFGEIDTGGDGRIDRREWEAFHRRLAEKKN